MEYLLAATSWSNPVSSHRRIWNTLVFRLLAQPYSRYSFRIDKSWSWIKWLSSHQEPTLLESPISWSLCSQWKEGLIQDRPLWIHGKEDSQRCFASFPHLISDGWRCKMSLQRHCWTTSAISESISWRW